MANYGLGWVTFYSPVYNYIVAINEAAKDAHQIIMADFRRFAELLSAKETDHIDIDGRDTILQEPDAISYSEEHKVWYAEIGFEFAWQVHPEVFHVICDQIFSGQVRYVYIGSETGAEYFENTDREGLFYPQILRAEIQIEDSDTEQEEFTTKAELVSWLQQLIKNFKLNIEIEESLSVKEMENRIYQACVDQNLEYGIISIAQYKAP